MNTSLKLLLAALLLAGCSPKRIDGTYVNHTEGQYSIADDTLIVADTVVINHTGFQKKRDGQLWPKAYKIRKWTLNSPDAPALQIANEQIIMGTTIYQKLP
jgi:hypothetical protein